MANNQHILNSQWYLQCFMLLISMCVISACSTNKRVIIEDIYINPATPPSSPSTQTQSSSSDTYVVRTGDTLYAIAWRYGWDYNSLAKANNIAAPYIIYVGQTLVINNTLVKATNKTSAEIATSTTQTGANNASKSNVTKPSVSVDVNKKNPQANTTVATYTGSKNLVWQWPVNGKILSNYAQGKDKNKGIDIAVSLDSQVKAAAKGQVVYAGDGLQGYGNLVIIKHNDTLLSAYAYNSKILVSEDDLVKVGQLIAKSGQGPQADGRLHFEIRKDGKPVNPTTYLP